MIFILPHPVESLSHGSCRLEVAQFRGKRGLDDQPNREIIIDCLYSQAEGGLKICMYLQNVSYQSLVARVLYIQSYFSLA